MKVVAVIGASRDRSKFGNKAVRAFRRQGFDVLPVNARRAGAGSAADRQIEGLPVHASVLDAPGAIDLATIYVPPEIGETLVEEIAAKGIPALWVNPGAESRRLVERARALGIETTLHCSIVAIGESPADFDDRPDPTPAGPADRGAAALGVHDKKVRFFTVRG